MRKFFLFILLLWALPAHGYVVLTVTEPSGVTRTNEPVTHGVPFSLSDTVTSTSGFKISTDIEGNNIVDAQFRVLSRYNDVPGGTGAIRVVLVDFQNSISADATETFYLRTSGGSGTVSGSDLATTSGSDVIVTTGALTATIDADTGWLSSVLIDSDGDLSVDDQVLGTTTSDGFLVRSSGGTDYASWNETSTVTIEENGPLKCVVKAVGYFEDSSNNKLIPTSADNGLEYTIRYTFFKNHRYVKIAATLKNENRAWTNNYSSYPTHPIDIDYAYLKLTSAVSDSGETVDFGGSTYSGLSSYSIHQDETSDGSTQTYTWAQSINGGGATANQFESYADTRDSAIGVMVGLRWFWQQHPKQFRFADGGDVLYVDLWPDESSDHTLLGGLWKTHDIVLYFHEDDDSDFANVHAALTDRLIARPSDIYIASTNFFYSIPPESISASASFHASEPTLSAVFAQDNKIRRGKIDSDYIDSLTNIYDLTEMRSGRRIPGPGSPAWWTWYGWLEFGDFPRGESTYGYSAGHYDWVYSTGVSWLRFENRDYFDLFEELVSHAADISIMHDQDSHDAAEWGGRFHGGHRYEHDALMSFNSTYSASQQNAPQTGSHFWSKGIALQYLLTGDFRYKDALEDTAEGRIYNYFTFKDCTSDCSSSYSLRDVGRSLEGLITAYTVLGTADYLTKATQIYTNDLIPREATYGSGTYYSSPAGDREASLLQSGTTIEPSIQLYYALLNSGDTANADLVKSGLEKQGTWYRDSVYTNWDCANGDSGDYISGTDYIPYGQCKEWDKDNEWVCGNCSITNSGYFFGRNYATDLFAFLYAEGYGDAWLDLARSVFKDEVVYHSGASGQVTIATTVYDSFGWNNDPSTGDSWAKDGEPIKKGLFYLSTENGESPILLNFSEAGQVNFDQTGTLNFNQ